MLSARQITRAVLCALPVLGAAACAADPHYADAGTPNANELPPLVDPGPATWPMGFHVVGNQIVDGNGQRVVLYGINRSGTEYRCVQGSGGFFDGPASEASVAALTSWPNVNAVRVPLNESCWLGINGAVPAYSGDNYKQAISNYVTLLHKYHLIPILELHWVGPGQTKASRQQPLPDADHAPEFWSDVATTFVNDSGVVLEAYNEPFWADHNMDSDPAWACWRDGCSTSLLGQGSSGAIGTYQTAGMQSIVDAIRGTGSTHVVLLGGLQYSNALTEWLTYQPTDPAGNLAAAWHVYNFNQCINQDCWNAAPAGVAAHVPLVATEIGENDCAGSNFLTPLMNWLDETQSGYLAWSWNAYGACQAASTTTNQGGQPWSLITDFASATPNGGYAQTFHDHVAGL